MSEQHIFSVYDQKAKAYLPIFILPEVGMAIRSFADCVNSKDHQFGMHPEDYTLLEIGIWDDRAATIESHQQPIVHGVGTMYKIQKQKTDQIDLIDMLEEGENQLDTARKLKEAKYQ